MPWHGLPIVNECCCRQTRKPILRKTRRTRKVVVPVANTSCRPRRPARAIRMPRIRSQGLLARRPEHACRTELTSPASVAPAAALCPPPPKSAAIRLQSTAALRLRQTDLDGAHRMFRQHDGHLRAVDGQRHVDEVFGLAPQSAGLGKILVQHIGVSQIAHPFERPGATGRSRAASHDSANRVRTTGGKSPADRHRHRSAARPPHTCCSASTRSGTSRCRWRWPANSAVAMDACQGRPGTATKSATSRPVASADVILEHHRVQLPVVRMMIDDHHLRRRVADHVGHAAQLSPGAGVEDHDHVDVLPDRKPLVAPLAGNTSSVDAAAGRRTPDAAARHRH